ncbi:UDP-galactose transporter 1-like [Hordeum vulgare subsp. vulgare]|uniref:UDP-galactose transporter 1-like n=1 Tax=Hordeum vulgare subsp. vulgare TaxID=112509 RepID=UPI001D1A37A6|nr:UDP-galactose transporter 1-like [Hordeum vulgare subsp. vulgare]
MGDGAAWVGQGGELESDPEGLGIADPFPVVAAAGVASTTEGELLGAAAMEVVRHPSLPPPIPCRRWWPSSTPPSSGAPRPAGPVAGPPPPRSSCSSWPTFPSSSSAAAVSPRGATAAALLLLLVAHFSTGRNRRGLDEELGTCSFILQCLVWSKHFEWRIWASLVPIVGGVLLTSMTELSFNIFGFCATMIGCLATSTKTILAESLLHGYKFDSINTVYYMAPFATMILALPAMLLEGGGVIDWFYTHDVFSSLIIILGSGVLAFCLNFSIFYVIHSTTAVTFNVAGNLKVAIAVLVSWLIFRNPIPPMNAIGCAITLVSCTFYGYVRHLISQQKAAAPLGNQGTNSPRSWVEMLHLVGDKEDKV